MSSFQFFVELTFTPANSEGRTAASLHADYFGGDVREGHIIGFGDRSRTGDAILSRLKETTQLQNSEDNRGCNQTLKGCTAPIPLRALPAEAVVVAGATVARCVVQIARMILADLIRQSECGREKVSRGKQSLPPSLAAKPFEVSVFEIQRSMREIG